MKHGGVVLAEDIAYAVTRGPLRYADGATQTFDPAGGTVYVEYGRSTRGEWYLDATGRFCSFWPPSYRACYEVRWIVEDHLVAGLSFRNGSYAAEGRYETPMLDELVMNELQVWADDGGAH